MLQVAVVKVSNWSPELQELKWFVPKKGQMTLERRGTSPSQEPNRKSNWPRLVSPGLKLSLGGHIEILTVRTIVVQEMILEKVEEDMMVRARISQSSALRQKRGPGVESQRPSSTETQTPAGFNNNNRPPQAEENEHIHRAEAELQREEIKELNISRLDQDLEEEEKSQSSSSPSEISKFESEFSFPLLTFICPGRRHDSCWPSLFKFQVQTWAFSLMNIWKCTSQPRKTQTTSGSRSWGSGPYSWTNSTRRWTDSTAAGTRRSVPYVSSLESHSTSNSTSGRSRYHGTVSTTAVLRVSQSVDSSCPGSASREHRGWRHRRCSVQRPRNLEQSQGSGSSGFWTGGSVLCGLWRQWWSSQSLSPQNEVTCFLIHLHWPLYMFCCRNFCPDPGWFLSLLQNYMLVLSTNIHTVETKVLPRTRTALRE